MKSQKIKLCYIASPYSAKGKMSKKEKLKLEQARDDVVSTVGAKLQLKFKKTHAFICPITQSAKLKLYEPKLGTKFSFWSSIDCRFIAACDEVWVIMMNGWEKSIGVKKEIEHAIKLHIPVVYIKVSIEKRK